MNIYLIIFLVLIFLSFIAYILWQIKKNGLRSFVIECIVYAERTFKDNQTKFNAVCNMVINKLPFPFNMIPTSIIADFVQKVFDEVKSALDYRDE